jgi:hypothetical protein
MTRYGRINASFSTISNGNTATDEDPLGITDEAFAARVAIVPCVCRKIPFRVIFDFNPTIDLTPKITYQAIIPNSSEVFEIVASGNIEELIKALNSCTTSLTVRDEEGRSLLHVSGYRASI